MHTSSVVFGRLGCVFSFLTTLLFVLNALVVETIGITERASYVMVLVLVCNDETSFFLFALRRVRIHPIVMLSCLSCRF